MIQCEGTCGVMPGGGARGQYLEHLCTMLRCCVSFSSTVKSRTVKPYIRLLLDVPTRHPH